MRARLDVLREVAIVFLAVTAATVLVSRLGRTSPLGEYVHLIVGALFLWTAIGMSQRGAPPRSAGEVPPPDGGLAHYGLALAGLLEPAAPPPAGLFGAVRDLASALLRAAPSALRELGAALVVAAVVFPPFVVGFYLWHDPARGFALQLPEDFGSYALTQLLVVGVPEEALFRGYMQTRLRDAFAGRVRVLGVSLSVPALLAQALLFALIHFAVDLNPARLAVFFPALLFGWVRERRAGIGAAAALHAACNLLSDVLVRSWL